MVPGLGSVLAGKYRLVGLLGEGGMGCVYEGVHLGTGRRVAVKVLAGRLAGDPAQVKRFELEAQAAALINHPGIVDVLDVGRDDSAAPFIVMERLFGATLRQLERALAPMTPGQVVGLVAPALEALAAAHAAGVIHRDLKPGNIFFAVQPVPAVKLLDFGISKFASGGELTATGVVMGTVAYMAPEQLRSGRNVGPASDLYSVGAVLYALFAGRPPYVAESDPQLVAEIITEDPERLAKHRPDLAAALCALVDGLLVKDPARRLASARALREQLLALSAPDLTGVVEIAARLAQPYTALDASAEAATPGGTQTRTALAPSTPLGVAPAGLQAPGPAGAGARTRSRRRVWLAAAGLFGAAAAASAVYSPELSALRRSLTRWVLLQPSIQQQVVERRPEVEDEAALLAKPLSRGWNALVSAPPPQPAQTVEQQPEWTPEVLADGGVVAVAARTLDHARGLRAAGNGPQALDALDALVARATAGADRSAEGHALRIRGDLALDLRRCAEADDYYRRAFKTFEAAGDALGAGIVAQDLGLLANVCKSNDREAWFAIALQRRVRAGDLPGMFKSANSLGLACLVFNRLEAAIDAFDQAVTAAEKLGDDHLQVKARANLATTWARLAQRRGVGFEARWAAGGLPASNDWAKVQAHLAAAAAAAKRAGSSPGAVCDDVPDGERGGCSQLLSDLR